MFTPAKEVKATSARRRRRVAATGPDDRVGGLVLAVSIVGSALLFGAQQRNVLVLGALLAAGAALLLRPSRLPRAALLLGVLVLHTLVQLVPLPFSWVEALSPASAEVWRKAFGPFGEPTPGWARLSVDPGATALEAVKWSGYVCVLLAATAWRARRGGKALAGLVFCSALAVALVTLAHGALDATHIYGTYLPIGASRWTRGPFVNENNLAGYLNLGFFSGLGLWLSAGDRPWNRPVPFGLAVLGLGTLMTGSRGGVLALALGIILLSFLVVRQRRPDWMRAGALLGTAALGLIAVAVFFVGGRLRDELLNRDIDAKVSAWRWSLDLIRDFPVFGAGRGAFETAFQPYRKPLGRDWTTVFAHAESFPLEWLADWGIPVGLVAIAGVLVLARGVFARALRDPLAAGLAVGLAALFLQNLADLALEHFAVTAAAFVAFAAAQEAPRGEVGRSFRVAALPAAVTVVSVIIVFASGAVPVRFEREAWSRTYTRFAESKSRDPSELLGGLRASIGSHPGEAYFPLIGALVARRTRRGDPLVWLGRSLERAPMNGTTHLALAQVMFERGVLSQAMLHMRFAALYDVTRREYALRHAAKWARTPDELVAVFPRGLPGSELIDDLCEVARPEHEVPCWREAAARAPTRATRLPLARSLLDAVEGTRSPCAGAESRGCTDEVERLLATFPKGRNDWEVALLAARLDAARGNLLKAAKRALESCPASSEVDECVSRAVDFARGSRDLATLGQAAERFAALRCVHPKRCAEAHDKLGEAYRELAAWGLALRHFSLASEAEPTADRFLASAEAAARVGSDGLARVSLERARKSTPFGSEHAERAALVEGLLLADAVPGLR